MIDTRKQARLMSQEITRRLTLRNMKYGFFREPYGYFREPYGYFREPYGYFRMSVNPNEGLLNSGSPTALFNFLP